MKNNKGLVYVFEGDGKGKTSAALGVALRMLLLDKKVLWVSWFKKTDWQISEAKMPEYFKVNLKMYFAGEGFYIKNGEDEVLGERSVKSAKVKVTKVYDFESPDSHKEAALKGLRLVNDALNLSAAFDLVVMDEALTAESEGLITSLELLATINKRRECHVVLTGKKCPEDLLPEVDLLTQMKKVKHPYDKGVMAVRGLDY